MAYVKGKNQPNLKSRSRAVSNGGKARCWHFKNAAAKTAALALYGEAVNDMALRIIGINSGAMSQQYFIPVELKMATHARVERQAGSPRHRAT